MEAELGIMYRMALHKRSCCDIVCVLPLVLVVVDVSDKKTRDQLDPHIVYTLNHHSHIPAVLLLNKVPRHSFCISPSFVPVTGIPG